MSSSLAIPVKISPSLSTLENEALLASYNPRIKELKKVDFVKTISQAITKAYMVMGSSPKDDYEMIVEEIVNDLKANYTVFTIQEICLAIDLGSKGKLGDEFVHVCVKGVLKWIWLYADKFRREAIHKQKLFDEKLAKETEEADRLANIRSFEETILAKYEAFPESFKKESKGTIAAMYRHLDKKGIIKMSDKEKKEIFAGVLRIKDRTKFSKASILEITAKELSEYRALRRLFRAWKSFGLDLKSEL